MQNSLEILVAEHDRDVAEGLSDILELAGHMVHLAFTVEETCELLRLRDFDVAFVNVKIPELSKLESFAEVRKIKPDANLVMMSAHTIDQLTSQVTDGGVVKVLDAPVTIDDVAEALDEIGSKGTMLVEEAPENFATTIQAALKDRDIDVVIAQDRGEALARLAEGNCDVLLLDLHLTVIRGLEVFLDLIRQGCSLPTIIFQSYAGDGPADHDISGSDILLKPFNPRRIVKLLEDMANKQDGGGAAAQAPAAPATPEAGDRADEPGPPDSDAAAPSEPNEVLIWKDAEPVQAAPVAPDGPLPDAGAAPPQATAPRYDQDQGPSVEGDRDAASGQPSLVAEAPVQAEAPEGSPSGGGITRTGAEDLPGEARLPDGIGLSVEQLEQAVNQTGRADPDPGDEAPAGEREAQQTSAEGIQVLVIDDDHDMAEGLAEILDDTGLDVKVAHSCEAALATIKDFDAKIALVDIQLGRNSGLELVPTLKELRPELIVVMVTAQTEQKTAIEALRRGAFDYLNKPLHPEELLAALDRCFDELAKRTAQAAAPQVRAAAVADPKVAGAEYMARLSHKLGTAHNPVVGFSEVLSEEMLGSPVPAHYADDTQDINDSGNLLEAIIEDFADIDRSDNGKVELNEGAVDFSRVIFRCLELVRPVVDAASLTVEIELAEIPAFLIGDRYKLTQIALSLLTNAVKFTPKQGRIHVIQRRAEDGGLLIEVKDTGVGIAEEAISQALASVIESDGDLNPDYAGSGLDLPLANSMVELHGGELTLNSEVGRGTTATLHFPPDRNIAPKRFIAV